MHTKSYLSHLMIEIIKLDKYPTYFNFCFLQIYIRINGPTLSTGTLKKIKCNNFKYSNFIMILFEWTKIF